MQRPDVLMTDDLSGKIDETFFQKRHFTVSLSFLMFTNASQSLTNEILNENSWCKRILCRIGTDLLTETKKEKRFAAAHEPLQR